jgi:hypothetical protein
LTIAKPQKPTLIDILNTGYTVLNRKLWIVGIPIVLNLYLWFGAPLSFAPFLTRLHDKLVLLASLLETDPFRQEQLVISMQNADMRDPLAILNLVPVLPDQVITIAKQSQEQPMYVRGLGGVLGSTMMINLFALLLSSLFLVLLAYAMQTPSLGVLPIIKRVLYTAWCLVGVVIVIVVLAMLLALPPLLIISVILIRFSEMPLPSLFFLWFVVGFWFYIFMGFAVEAIVLDKVGPIVAIKRSMQLVYQHFLSTVTLLLLLFLIGSGLNVIWGILAHSPIGMAIAIVGSAYIGSGLATARLAFYQAYQQMTGQET